MKRRRKIKRAAGRTMTVTTSSRVVKTTRMNPRGLSLEPYRREFKVDRGRYRVSINTVHGTKHTRKMMRALFPGWSKEQHVQRLIELSRMVHVAGGVWGRIAKKAHLETFGTTQRTIGDYRVSGVGRDEYPERLKGRLRIAARAESTIFRAIHAHALMAGKTAMRRAGVSPEMVASSYKDNPPKMSRDEWLAQFWREIVKLIPDTHANYMDQGMWANAHMYLREGKAPKFAAKSTVRSLPRLKKSNPGDPRTAQTQRLPVIRVMIPAGGKDPRTAETRRLRVVTSVHRKNPVRSLAVPRTMWKRLKRADKKTKYGHRYVRCKTRRARRAFWLPCTVR